MTNQGANYIIYLPLGADLKGTRNVVLSRLLVRGESVTKPVSTERNVYSLKVTRPVSLNVKGLWFLK